MKTRMIRVVLLVIAVTVTISLQSGILRAQNSIITLKVNVPYFYISMTPFITEQVMKEFSAAYPGINIQLVPMQDRKARTELTLDEHLDLYRDLANKGDLTFIDTFYMPWTAFQAGYFLDLMPLVKADPTLDSDDFYPAVWQSFQMDNALWAMPTTTEALMLQYGQIPFDNRELAYPTDQWTKEDIEKAAIALTVRNRRTGAVKTPGLGWSDYYNVKDITLLRGLLGENVFDSTTTPAIPSLDSPALEQLLTWWVKLNQDGYAADDSAATMRPWNVGYWANYGSDGDEKNAVLLPGGKAGLYVQGFAVSAGTQYPQEAYNLAKFLTTRPEMMGLGRASFARKSLKGLDQAFHFIIPLPPDTQERLDKLLTDGIPMSDMRYMEYVYYAFNNMMTNNVDAKTALLAAQDQAIKDMQHIAERKQKDIVVVSPPDTAELPAGKIALNFGLASTVMPLPNQEQWDDLGAEFASSDPQVGKVNLYVDSRQDIVELAQKQDCFYLPYNAIPNLPAGLLLNLDPFLSTDKTFDSDDVVAGIMPQLQRDNKTWGLPIALTPVVLKYNVEQFQKAGISLPTSDWTVDAFVDALKTLKSSEDAPAPFAIDISVGGSPILMLIAAYGGVPLDYRTDPITVNFTDPATVDAIRQVLDLAKQGYIKYDGLVLSSGNMTIGNPTGATLYTELFRASNFGDSSPYKAILFPRGTHSQAVSFSIGTGYISANAQNPEACYRWLSTLANHLEVVSAMPARRSLISTVAPTQGADLVAFYNDLDTLTQDPETVTIPLWLGSGGSPAGSALQRWLFRAFDNYVLHDADLDTQLKDAESYAKAFQECLTQLPDTSEPDSIGKRFAQANTCAVKVDPSLK